MGLEWGEGGQGKKRRGGGGGGRGGGEDGRGAVFFGISGGGRCSVNGRGGRGRGRGYFLIVGRISFCLVGRDRTERCGSNAVKSLVLAVNGQRQRAQRAPT